MAHNARIIHVHPSYNCLLHQPVKAAMSMNKVVDLHAVFHKVQAILEPIIPNAASH